MLEYGHGQWRREELKDPDSLITMAGVVDDIVAGLRGRAKPEMSVTNALRATEVIFAVYESSRRRARVDLPLETEDSAFLTMLSDGVLGGR